MPNFFKNMANSTNKTMVKITQATKVGINPYFGKAYANNKKGNDEGGRKCKKRTNRLNN